MKSILICLVLIFSASSFGAFSGAPIDLQKFEAAAKLELKSNNLDDNGVIYFQDGVLPDEMTSEKVYEDLAELYFVSNNTIQNYGVVYSLNLSTGKTRLDFMTLSNNKRTEASLGMFFELSSDEEVLIVKDDLLQKYPKIKTVKIGSSLNVLTQDYSYFNEVKAALDYIKVTYRPKGAHFNQSFSAFSQPVFGLLQPLQQPTADLDKLRDVVPSLVEQGTNFATTESVIPDNLKL